MTAQFDLPGLSWMADAACRGVDSSLFFPRRGDTPTVKAAKAVCAGCPVRQPCLDMALANKEMSGIFGGLSERERRRMRRDRPRPPTSRPRVTGCPRGHPYTEANTYLTSGGYRRCRQCQRDTANAQRRAAGIPVKPPGDHARARRAASGAQAVDLANFLESRRTNRRTA